MRQNPRNARAPRERGDSAFKPFGIIAGQDLIEQ